MVLVASAIEDHPLDSGFDGSLGDRPSHQLGHLALILAQRLRPQRRVEGRGLAVLCLEDIVPCEKKYGEKEDLIGFVVALDRHGVVRRERPMVGRFKASPDARA